jgi:hypothetical protein
MPAPVELDIGQRLVAAIEEAMQDSPSDLGPVVKTVRASASRAPSRRGGNGRPVRARPGHYIVFGLEAVACARSISRPAL